MAGRSRYRQRRLHVVRWAVVLTVRLRRGWCFRPEAHRRTGFGFAGRAGKGRRDSKAPVGRRVLPTVSCLRIIEGGASIRRSRPQAPGSTWNACWDGLHAERCWMESRRPSLRVRKPSRSPESRVPLGTIRRTSSHLTCGVVSPSAVELRVSRAEATTGVGPTWSARAGVGHFLRLGGDGGGAMFAFGRGGAGPR